MNAQQAVTAGSGRQARTKLGLTVLLLGGLVLSVVSIPEPAVAQETAEELYQAGLYQEEVQGNLERAIGLYERILGEFPSNRSVAANALLHVGLCHEKLGSQEARRAYLRLLREYADQTSVAGRARMRLASLEGLAGTESQPPAVGAEGIVIRNLAGRDYGVALDATGRPSPDGRYLASVDWGPIAANIGILDLVTKEYRLVTDHPGMEEGMALSADFAPDSNTIAYTWLRADGSIEIRLAFRDGSPPRTLLADSQYTYWPDAWAPGGRRLLVERERRSGESSVETGWVSLDDEDFLVVGTAEPGQPESHRWSPSPNGDYLAFDFDVPEDSRRRDIALIPADGGRPIPIIQHPANDQVVGWVPGTHELLFVSDRGGRYDLLAIEVVDGDVRHGPRTILRDVGPMEPMGFTRGGDLFYWIRTLRFSVSLAPFDSETGAVDLAEMKPLVGMKSSPDWSPDGRFLTYWHKKDRAHAADYDQVLGITDLETGQERELAPDLEVERPKWSLDGESILALAVERGKEDSVGPGLFSIDPQTGEAEELVRFGRDPDYWASGIGATPAAKRRDFVYVSEGRMVLHDATSGEETELYRHPGLTTRPLASSPDGRHLVFAVVDSMTWSGIGSERPSLGDGPGRLMLMRLPGGEMEELLALEPQTGIEIVDWGPEGRYLYFDWHEADDTRVLKRIPVEGGQPEIAWSPAFGRFSLSPNGDRIAFTRFVQKADVYLMENLRSALQSLEENR